VDVDERMRPIIEGFVAEAHEIVEVVTRQLLQIEAARDSSQEELGPSWDEAARGLHTLKGAAGSLGMEELARLAHRMEDLIAPYRKAKTVMPAAAVDALLKGLDAFVAGVRAVAESSPEVDLSSVMGTIAALVLSDGPGPATSAPRPLPDRGAASAAGGPLSSPEAERAPEIRDAGGPDRGWRVQARDVLALVREVDRLREVRLRLDERRRQVLALRRGEGGAGGGDDDVFPIASALKSEVEEVGQIIEALENRIRDLGAQPVRVIMEPLRRLLRDACRSSSKSAKLSVVGEDISLDRNLLQGLRESLVHMIRNAVDHGIERPAERERAGKHREGAVVLRVEQHGNVLYVEFSDDGAGLDLESLRSLAVVRGIVRKDEASALDPAFLSQLIFGAGLSTSATVTETSGRGVGLDAVRAWVDVMRGQVDVHSVAGQGTRFGFTLPLELGSSPLLLVRAGDQQLGIPLSAVERVVSATHDSIGHGRSGPELRYGDRWIPVCDLSSALELRQPSLPTHGQPIVVVQAQGSRAGVVVDEVVGDLDLVIRALPREIADIAAFQGAAMTSRGELLLVLRPTWLEGKTTTAAPAVQTRRALVVDDSMTARALHRAMLEAGGYAVHAVGSATQALEWLVRGRYDVVVCDFAMTPMDGIAFTTTVRSHAELRATPIVLVSARDDVGLRVRVLEAGADAFLSKAECAEGRLLAEVSGVVARRGAAA
jgi:two-component system, chemotaxis family, sensor kinase CheA